MGTGQGPIVTGNCMDFIAELKGLDRPIQNIIINDGLRKTTLILGVKVPGTTTGNS